MEIENKELNVNDLQELKEKLSALKELLDDGLITKEEFAENRKQIMLKISNPISDISIKKPNNESKVRKCPNCGEILGAFDTSCPTCGCELRNSDITNAMELFMKKLSEFDNKREKLSMSDDDNSYDKIQELNDIEFEYIKNYIVPRTKEDFLEFAVLSKSNIELRLYKKNGTFDFTHGCGTVSEYNRRKKFSDAWWSMLQQIFDKSKIMFSNDDDTYKKIEQLYVAVYNQIM